MKKKILAFTLIVILLVSTSSSVFALGMPAAHGLTGAQFGNAVSSLPPGAIANHVSGKALGMPTAHGLTGAEFGKAVSSLPPGAIAAHVSGK